MGYFRHHAALVESTSIGDRTRIWAFAHILPGARIGEDCNICDHTFIENDVVLGDRFGTSCAPDLIDCAEAAFRGHGATLHLIERFTRAANDELHYEVTVDDPRTYTRPWKSAWTSQWVADKEIQEYFCEENAESTLARPQGGSR